MLSTYLPSTWRRLTANFIDEVLMLPFYIPFAGIFLRMMFSDEAVTISLMTFALILIIPAVYEFIFLVMLQATPGKWLLGLTVVPSCDVETPLDWRQSLLRATSKRLSLFFSLAIYVLAFFRYDRTHLADWVAETRVVQNQPRQKPARIRWFLGSIFLVYFCIEGWMGAMRVAQTIDWQNKRVHVDDLLEAFQLEEMDDFDE